MDKKQWIQNKIIDASALQRLVNIWKASGKKVVFTNGCYDILHKGHLTLLTQAAQLGDKLIVALNTDASVKRLKGEERPLNNEEDRAMQMASLLLVDAVCLFDEDTPENLIKTLNPDILVKGGDYTIDNIVGAEHVQSYGGNVQTIPFVEGYSTSSLLERIKKL